MKDHLEVKGLRISNKFTINIISLEIKFVTKNLFKFL